MQKKHNSIAKAMELCLFYNSIAKAMELCLFCLKPLEFCQMSLSLLVI